MALFGTVRDANMQFGVAAEFVNNVVTQQIGYYKVVLPATPPNMYGEAFVKQYIGPVLLNCLIVRGDFTTVTDNNFGPDSRREVDFRFLKPDLEAANVVPETGDIIMYNELYYEVDNTNENQLFLVDKLIVPADPQYGNPNLVFSEPFKPGQPEFNRAYETAFEPIADKKYSIGLEDIDLSIMYHFTNVLKLTVFQNNSTVLVPIIYGSPEKWKSIQKDGYYRDNAARIMSPLLVFKRSSVVQNRTLGNKIDGNAAKNVQLYEKPFSRKNIYDNFNVLQNQKPQREYTVVVTPDYVTVNYTVIMWTNFVEQMNKLIEAVNFASNSYWGDPDSFQFLAKTETFNDAQVYEQGEDRLVRTEFDLTVNGYLIPDSLNAYLAQLSGKTYNICKIVFTTEQVQ